jgi:hypothetical protein
MSHRRLTSLTAQAVVLSLVLLAALPVAAQTSSAKAAAVKDSTARLADGHPDLQGFYSNSTVVPMERPKTLGAKEFYAPDEKRAPSGGGRGARPAAAAGEEAPLAVHYDVSQYGLNQKTLAPNLRTSLIIGPEGRIPAQTAEAQKRASDRQAANRGHQFDSAQNRPLSERCILWPHEGPPMLPAGYNANLEVVQGPGYVAILQEMIHDARIIPTDNSPHLPSTVRLYQGDSRGHWEGDTLVIDTTNFTDKTAYQGSSENLHMVEKLWRVDAETVMYQFTAEDPHTWAAPWTAQIPMVRTQGPIYEYACHEGNYGIANILSGVRATEAAAK